MDNCEQSFINAITKGFQRSPKQINKLHESDAELVQLFPNGPLLAITIDSLVEEIETGLYDDPELIGWMMVMASASDLAAVGAMPIGLLVSETFLKDLEPQYLEKLQNAIAEASRVTGLYVLGGDSNFASSMQFSTVALGTVPQNKIITRKGSRPGDILMSTGPLGSGNLYAYEKCIQKVRPSEYRPYARLNEGQIVRQVASGCIDTSDGLFSALDDLGFLNGVGFDITAPIEQLLHKAIMKKELEIPLWSFLAGHHGEYELVFTVPKENRERLLVESEKIGFTPVQLGYITDTQKIVMNGLSIPIGAVRQTWQDAKGDIEYYIKKLIQAGDYE